MVVVTWIGVVGISTDDVSTSVGSNFVNVGAEGTTTLTATIFMLVLPSSGCDCVTYLAKNHDMTVTIAKVIKNVVVSAFVAFKVAPLENSYCVWFLLVYYLILLPKTHF